MILVDTSVWVGHLRKTDRALSDALNAARVMIHPFVIGEMACGRLRIRAEVLELLHALPQVPVASDAEALEFIERHGLMGRGVGYVDAHLLAGTALAGTARLWTHDGRLAAVAAELSLDHRIG